MNPQGSGPWPELLPRPRSFDVLLWVRNVSLAVALVAGLISLPRSQSVIGLTLTIGYFLLTYWLFVTY